MRVAVEEPVPEDHRHPRLRHQVREVAAILERPFVRIEVGDLDAVEPLERQDPAARVGPEHLRHTHVRMPGEVAVERLRVPRLQPVVELLPDRPGELVDELLGVDEVERTDALLRDPRGLVEQGDVRFDLTRRAGTLHLHGDVLAVRERRAVHLTDRRGSDRPVLELHEELVDRQAEVFLDHLLDVGERERAHVVLKAAQLGDDVGRKNVGTRREELSELDERRAELVEHLAQVLATLRRLIVGSSRRDRRGKRSVSRWVSNQYPKPWRTATCAISERRPRLRVAGWAIASV